MKTLKITASVLLLSAAISSCDTCKTCSYTDELGEAQTTNQTCGDTDEMNAFETGMENTWGSYGTVTCVED